MLRFDEGAKLFVEAGKPEDPVYNISKEWEAMHVEADLKRSNIREFIAAQKNLQEQNLLEYSSLPYVRHEPFISYGSGLRLSSISVVRPAFVIDVKRTGTVYTKGRRCWT